MTYQEFLQKKPSRGWIEISDTRLNLLSAIHESNRFTGTIKKVYIDKVVINRPVRGLLQFGVNTVSGDRGKIQALDPNIAPDFAVLEDGAEPHVGVSAFTVMVGVGLAGLLLARARRTRPSTLPAPGSPGESSPPAGPQSPQVA